ncbi:MAG: Bax inhibitor-1/YccA family protein [Muribaculaceae bacterium]
MQYNQYNNQQYSQYDQYNQPPQYVSGSLVSNVMKRVYLTMTLGLLITAFTSLFCANSDSVITFFVQNSWAMWVLVIAELGIVFGVSAGINRLSTGTAMALFILFAVINGLMLFPIFKVYTGESIAKTFFITAGTFGAMTIYGYCTNRDLSRWGSILFMALIGLIIASLVNIFVDSDTMGWIISVVGVLIFVGLTAWDTQQIKTMALTAPGAAAGRLAVLGALTLYLDFINMFLYLLRFFGDSRD